MRILVLGAGAIGGYYGAQLAAADADVTFLVRPGRAAQLDRDGLVLVSRGAETRQRVRHITSAEGTAPFDLILLTCKAYDLADAIEAIASAVGPATAILPLLNGIAHLDALDARFGPARVLGGACIIATTLTPDGTILHASPGDLIIFGARDGTTPPPVEALAAAFAGTPVTARIAPDILQQMWEKWHMLAAGAALTCLLRATVGEIMATMHGAATAEAIMAECRAITTALGHPPGEAALAQTRRLLTDPASRWAASMMRDIEQRRPRLEADHILGDLIRRGAGVGIAAPLLAAAHAQLQVYGARAAA